MELTPELFEKIEFTERRKGYDTEQVETFLEDAGTALAQLLARTRHIEERAASADARIADAEARAAAAEERAARVERQAREAIAAAESARTSAAMSEEAEVEQAAKTLLMARRTAEAMEQEARGQSQALLGEAKTRADRQLAEAQAEAEELIRRARAQAEDEYADRRTRVLEEVQNLEVRRSQLGDVLTQLEARLAAYREDLTTTAEELTLLASDPDRLGARPTLSIPPDEVLPREVEVEVDADAGLDEGAADEVVVDEVAVTELDVSEGGADGGTDEVLDLGDGGGEAPSGPESQAWGPGSWSRIAGGQAGSTVVEPQSRVDLDVALDGDDDEDGGTISLQDETVLHDAAVLQDDDVEGAGQRDRYLEELDSAVNEAVPVDDEAMTAFFEGSNEGRGRRFGWRR